MSDGAMEGATARTNYIWLARVCPVETTTSSPD